MSEDEESGYKAVKQAATCGNSAHVIIPKKHHGRSVIIEIPPHGD